jgi:hypothetical protein
LCGLGLQQYVTAFHDNAIDAEVLSELTETDLEKLGVLLGHRKRLLKAIEGLRKPMSRPASPVAPAPGNSPPEGKRNRNARIVQTIKDSDSGLGRGHQRRRSHCVHMQTM